MSWRGSRARWALTVLVGGLVLAWVALDLVRARVYLAIGAPLQAWEAALKAPPSAARDDALARAMGARITRADGQTTSLWRAQLASATRDSRAPAWVRYGVRGRAVAALIAELEQWPWLACGEPPADLDLEWRLLSLDQTAMDRSSAQEDAYIAASEAVLSRKPLAERTDRDQQLAAAAGQMAGLVAYGLWEDEDAVPPTLIHVGRALRRGHLVSPEPTGRLECVACDRIDEPAPGVQESPDGALDWQDAAGKTHHLPPPTWFPQPP